MRGRNLLFGECFISGSVPLEIEIHCSLAKKARRVFVG